MPQHAHLVVAWNWEYDADWLSLLDAACRARGLTLIQVKPDTLADTLARIRSGDLSVGVLLDRAWDVDETFYPLADECLARGARILNHRPLALRAWDKATMHLEFISAGLHTPHTIVLQPFAEKPDLPPPNLTPLGNPFILKPALGGGGAGVTRDLTAWAQVSQLRQEFPTDKYLVQAVVMSRLTESGPAWFRVVYALGKVLPFWWDVQSHVYRPLTTPEESRFGLAPLRDIARTIARVCRLDLFSTEVAQRDGDGQFVSVDYVNDPIDLRLQSKAGDGVPDEAVRCMADFIAECATTPMDQ